MIYDPKYDLTAMSKLAEELTHLKNHVQYPANKSQVIAACNGMTDAPPEDRQWVSQTLPEGNYTTADQVVSALLSKV